MAGDGFAGLRAAVHALAEERGEWAGYPMPMEGSQLRIHPSYGYAAKLMAACMLKEPPLPEGERLCKVRNTFWSWRWRMNVHVVEGEDGICHWQPAEPAPHHVTLLMETLSVSDAWGIEQEMRAQQLLASLIPPRQFKQYYLTGMFMESSRRSKVHYLFRKLRPTLAISEATGTLRILCALCLHPIAYYDGSWAGAMCPTDDVIAHLMLMRGDEHMFWRRANQHPPTSHAAGI